MSNEIWTAKECADYLKVGTKHFLRDVRYRMGFPKQLEWSVEGRPRWAARDVEAWALDRQSYATAA